MEIGSKESSTVTQNERVKERGTASGCGKYKFQCFGGEGVQGCVVVQVIVGMPARRLDLSFQFT